MLSKTLSVFKRSHLLRRGAGGEAHATSAKRPSTSEAAKPLSVYKTAGRLQATIGWVYAPAVARRTNSVVSLSISTLAFRSLPYSCTPIPETLASP
jgi:hypothetical protein